MDPRANRMVRLGLNAEDAELLVKAGFGDPGSIKAATDKALKEAGLTPARLKKVRGVFPRKVS